MLSEYILSYLFFNYKIPFWFSLIILGISTCLIFFLWLIITRIKVKGFIAAGIICGFGLFDYLLLSLLPIFKLSFGPIGLPLLGMILIRVILFLVIFFLWQVFALFFPGLRTKKAVFFWLIFLILLNTGIFACEIEGLYIEPFRVSVSRIIITHPTFPKKEQLRIVQLSDLHIERITKREHKVLEILQNLEPDIIVLTGDYLNLSYIRDSLAREQLKWFIGELKANHYIFAITVSNVDIKAVMDNSFAKSNIRMLYDEIIQMKIKEFDFTIIGITYKSNIRDRLMLEILTKQTKPKGFTLLLYHTPDLIETAVDANINLYLCGHTHGGQIRFPIIGAIYTSSKYKRKYDMGKYEVNNTIMYVNRGIGMEGMDAPRARFLCTPEILIVDILSDHDIED